MNAKTLVPLTALLLSSACAQPDDPFEVIAGYEEPEEPEWPEEPDWPEQPEDPAEPQPEPEPEPEAEHIAEGNYAWTVNKTVDASVTDCSLSVDSLRDLAWIEGHPDGAWMNLVEADDDPTGYTVGCAREGDELVCEEFTTELGGVPVRHFLQVQPAADGRGRDGRRAADRGRVGRRRELPDRLGRGDGPDAHAAAGPHELRE
jgi:hypothetical protein